MKLTHEQEARRAEMEAAAAAYGAAGARFLESLKPTEEEHEDAVVMCEEGFRDWSPADITGFEGWLGENVVTAREGIDEEVVAELRTGWTIETIAEVLGHSVAAIEASVARIKAEQEQTK